jgi:hypothetical protein
LIAIADGARKVGDPELLSPVVEKTWLKLLILAAAYVITLAFSGSIVGYFVSGPSSSDSNEPSSSKSLSRISRVIGKCENIITVTLVLAGAETGLALIFAAKALVRNDDIKQDPGYFLGGTLVNLVWAMSVSFTARVLIAGV